MDIGKRDKEMQLNIWDYAVIEFKMGQRALFTFLVVCVLGGNIEFPVPMLNSFRIISYEWWTSPCRRWNKNCQT
jgi:branched-subunit amino acid ABC-type transport system permease component